MVFGKYTTDIRNAHKIIHLLMACGQLSLNKRWENGNWGHYLVTKDGEEVRINANEYETIYKAHYQER